MDDVTNVGVLPQYRDWFQHHPFPIFIDPAKQGSHIEEVEDDAPTQGQGQSQGQGQRAEASRQAGGNPSTSSSKILASGRQQRGEGGSLRTVGVRLGEVRVPEGGEEERAALRQVH